MKSTSVTSTAHLKNALRMIQLKDKAHLKIAIEMLSSKDYIDREDYDSFKEYVDAAKAKKQEVTNSISEWLDQGIKEFTNNDKFGVVSPAFSEGGIARVTWYDANGFYSHDGANTPDQLIDILVEGLGINIQPAPGSLDAMSQTEQWYLGMEKVKEVRRLNQQLNQKAFQRWMSHSSWVNSDEINKAILWANELDEVIALRVDKKGLPIGYTFPPSRVWDDGYATEEILDGASCIRIDRSGNFGKYPGDQIYAVSGRSLYEGNDPGELIVENATIEAIWNPL